MKHMHRYHLWKRSRPKKKKDRSYLQCFRELDAKGDISNLDHFDFELIQDGTISKSTSLSQASKPVPTKRSHRMISKLRRIAPKPAEDPTLMQSYNSTSNDKINDNFESTLIVDQSSARSAGITTSPENQDCEQIYDNSMDKSDAQSLPTLTQDFVQNVSELITLPDSPHPQSRVQDVENITLPNFQSEYPQIPRSGTPDTVQLNGVTIDPQPDSGFISDNQQSHTTFSFKPDGYASWDERTFGYLQSK